MAQEETEMDISIRCIFSNNSDSILDDKSVLIGDGGDFMYMCIYCTTERTIYMA